ncbi:MAG: 50S ribosomal protein L6 [Rhodobacteraceae bacterium]|nr:50S ribosomal protein L6 [Paracoccaceae bacterium]MYE37720.1 50S ribosomal protein L6 [Paracoccaceae bacterium]MYG42765.1 50S ribosomal protein L6 [Paracoccaceae bacterium]
MSRIGKLPIKIPAGVETGLDDQEIIVKGPRGTLSFTAPNEISVEIDNQQIKVKPRQNNIKSRQKWGMSRTMIANCVKGVTEGFTKELQINGVGYRAQMKGNSLNLTLGLSHEVNIDVPKEITITTPSNTRIVIEGNDPQAVGKIAADIRKWRPPEPYKGKGIRYLNEYVYRKVGKKK